MKYVPDIVYLIFGNKCNTIFNVLFGVSFYLVLKNPQYTARKFAKRCVLLCVFGGLFNMFFYWGDVLLMYGFCGIALLLFRNCKPSQLLVLSLISLLVAHFLNDYVGLEKFNSVIINRLDYNNSIADKLSLWQKGLHKWILFWQADIIFRVFAFFLFGYCIAKQGWIEKLDRIKFKHIICLSFLFISTLFVNRTLHLYVLREIGNLTGALLYSAIIAYLYYGCGWGRFMKYIEPYGRLGLTN